MSGVLGLSGDGGGSGGSGACACGGGNGGLRLGEEGPAMGWAAGGAGAGAGAGAWAGRRSFFVRWADETGGEEGGVGREGDFFHFSSNSVYNRHRPFNKARTK